MDNADLVIDSIKSSPYHSWWGVREIELYVERPNDLGQFVWGDGFLCSWGFPNIAEVKKYLESGRFDPDWFDSDGSTPWIVDFISLRGKVREDFCYMKDLLGGMGYTEAYWLRTETRKLGWFRLGAIDG